MTIQTTEPSHQLKKWFNFFSIIQVAYKMFLMTSSLRKDLLETKVQKQQCIVRNLLITLISLTASMKKLDIKLSLIDNSFILIMNGFSNLMKCYRDIRMRLSIKVIQWRCLWDMQDMVFIVCGETIVSCWVYKEANLIFISILMMQKVKESVMVSWLKFTIRLVHS